MTRASPDDERRTQVLEGAGQHPDPYANPHPDPYANRSLRLYALWPAFVISARKHSATIPVFLRPLMLWPAFALALATNFQSCTDARLQPVAGDIDYVDNKLSISGTFCTSPPDEVTFPVKILILVDQSASLQCTDPGNNRLTALSEMGAELDPLPNVEFGVIGFASWSRVTDFTTDWSEASQALAPAGGEGGPATDYQGVLATALSVIEQDIIDSGAAETARTKYVLLFMSDGIPEPRCRAGCDDGDTPPDSLYGVCNTDQEVPDDEYVDMNGPCPEYNMDPQILQRVQDIVSLETYYGVGALSLNTVLLFAPEEEIAEVCGDVTQFGYVREEAEPLLQSMAEAGGGTYRDVNISTDLDFLDFDYESLEAPYELAELFAINLNAVPNGLEVEIDSDRDGLVDTLEFDAGMDRFNADTDGDLFSDLLEDRYRFHGFDPLDGEVPAVGCDDSSDRDADGLLECEEAFLTTDPLLADTDGDRIPDGIELRLEMDPTVHDTFVDHDLDGRMSGLEIRTGTHPRRFDSDAALVNQIHYSVAPLSQDGEGRRCYQFQFQGITLVTTVSESNAKGMNQVLIVAEEEPEGLAGSRGRIHVACVNARYLGDSWKDPPSGVIDGLDSGRFVPLESFDPDDHCLGMGEDPGISLKGTAQ